MERVSYDEQVAVEAVENVHLTQLAAGDRTSIQTFEVEPGALVPEHSHPHEQCGFVFEGTATFLVDGEEIVIGPNDSYVIPGDEPHAVENRGDTPVFGVDVFSPPRANPDWGDSGDE